MQQKYENSKIVQIPLLNIVRIKKSGLTLSEIKKIKIHFLKTGSKILSVNIKPTRMEGEKK